MDVFEITAYETGVSNAGVNYLQPADSFQNIENGFIYRQVLQSRKGVGFFAPRLADNSRIFGIFEHTLPDSTKELLAIDKNFLYKFNTATGIFDQIPFAGSLLPGGGNDYAGFNISSNEFYVSGTSYPTKSNGARFIFTGRGFNSLFPNAAPISSTIFVYNGTDVKTFTDNAVGGDNEDYAPPPQGPLTSATFVVWFNERLNFIIPVIDGIQYFQGTLYSGIRTTLGNGDKFDVAGSGLFQADTYQVITGCTLLGQVMIHNYNRMAFAMEKTKDAFNPYFGRAIPGVLGTNANFSAVAWDDVVVSLGKTGVLSTSERKNLRTDNKIPNFTRDSIDQKEFDLTYGGFDRINNQFLWSYKMLESDTDTQNSVLVKNYEENSWSVYDQRFSVLGQTDIGIDLLWNQIDDALGNESWARWDTTEELWNKIGLGEAIQKTLAGDDLGFIYELNQDYDDYFTNISAVAPGATTTLTVTAIGILAGDLVTVANVEGMTQLNNFNTSTNEMIGDLYTVISATPTSIEINVDSTLYDAYTINTGSLSKIISFKAETIPFNPYRPQGMRVYVSHVEFYIDTNGGSLLVDVYADQEATPFRRNILAKPTDTTKAAEWISMSVDQEANFLTFVLKQQSPAVQLRLTSMRLHTAPGGMTSA